MLQISWKDRVTNIDVRNKVHNLENLIDKISVRKLRYYGHIKRRGDDCLENIVMNGRVDDAVLLQKSPDDDACRREGTQTQGNRSPSAYKTRWGL